MVDAFGIFMALFMSGTAIFFLVRMRRESLKKRKKDDPQARRDRATWAWARIVNAINEAPGLGGMVRVTMELEVHLPGTHPYTVTTTWRVEQESLKYLEMGNEVSLKVDPQDPKFIYPSGSWAKIVE